MKCPYSRNGEHGFFPLGVPKATTAPYIVQNWGCICGAFKTVQHDIDLAAVERGGREDETEKTPGANLSVHDVRGQPSGA